MAHQGVVAGYGESALVSKALVDYVGIGAGNMGVAWDRENVPFNPLGIYNKLRQCLAVMREMSAPFPTVAGDFISVAIATGDSKAKAIVLEQAPLTVLAPDSMTVAYSGTFMFEREGASGLLQATGTRLLNRLLEDMKKL